MKVISCLMMGFLVLMLQACSTKAGVQPIQKTVNVYPPDSLLVIPCKATPAGESLIDLAIAQNKNVACISKLHKSLLKIRDNKAQQKELYNVKP